MDSLGDKELLELYKLEISRENEIRARWRKSMEVYITLMLTVFSSSIIFANFLSDKTLSMFCLIGGGSIVVMLAIIAYFHFRLDYRYQMEILSIQAKIEDLLGLTDTNKYRLPLRWKNEALLPPWYYNSKNTESSTKEFVKEMCSLRRTNFYPLVYLIMSLIGIGLIVFGIIYGIK